MNDHGTYRAEVRRIVEAARTASGNAEKFAARLAEMGITGENGRPYSQSAVSNWTTGRAVPPGDVVLAAMEIAELLPDSVAFVGRSPEAWSAEPWAHDLDSPLIDETRAVPYAPAAMASPALIDGTEDRPALERSVADLQAQVEAIWAVVRHLQKGSVS